MASAITIQSAGKDNPETITTADGGFLSFGREPENAVVVNSDAVSRQHACIGNFGSQWLFWDLESTNGSWLNGQKAEGNEMFLLRVGDVVQLADFVFRIADEYGKTPEQGVKAFGSEVTLLVFENGEFVKESSLHKVGSQFVVGGPESDLEVVQHDGGSLSLLSIVQSGQTIELSVNPAVSDVAVNGLTVDQSRVLEDRDKITFGPYTFFLNKPDKSLGLVESPAQFATPEAAPHELHEVAAYDRYSLPKHLQGSDEDWQSEVGRRRTNSGRKFIFGGEESQNLTQPSQMVESPDDARFGRGLSALHQSSLSSQPSERSLLQRAGIAVGVLALLALFAWALSNMLASS